MYFRTTQFFRRYFFIGYGFYNIWPGHEHVGGVARHENKISNGRRIHIAPRARPHNHGDLGNNTRSQCVTLENLGIAAKRVNPFLNACPASIQHADNRRTVAQGHVLHLVDFARMRTRQRPAEHGEIFRINIDGAPVHRAPAGDNAVTGYFALFHAELMAVMLDKHVDLFKTAGIQKQIYSFTGGQLATRVLGFNPFFTTTLARHLAALFKHAINIVQKSALPFKPQLYGLSAEKYRFSA